MTKEELKDILRLKNRIDSYVRQLQELEGYATSIAAIDYSKDRVQTSPRNKIEETMIKIYDLELILNDYINELVSMKIRAVKVISQLDGKYNEIMSLRYLECLSWDEVIKRAHYTEQHVHRIHGEALLQIQKLREKDVRQS